VPRWNGVVSVETLRPALGLVLVDAIDRRVLPALDVAATLRGFDIKAVHIALDEDDGRRVAEAWMRLDLGWAPLEIEEAGERSFLTAVNEVVTREVARRSRVVVIVPELDLRGRWQSLLHRGTGRWIARSLQSTRGVCTIVVPYTTT
jgi:hypothetical protein